MKAKEKKRIYNEIPEAIDSENFLKEMENSLDFYRKSFISDDPFYIVELEDNYPKILTIMKNSLQNHNNQICVLYGFPGFGRKSSIDYCLNSLKNEHVKKIFIDASFYSSEPAFINCFLSQLYDNEKIKKMKDPILSFSNLYTLFKKQNIDEKVVLIIDKVEELATNKKQTILYGLLEWIRTENNGIFLILMTNNIMFSDMLEKRNKSRLSQTYKIIYK